MANEEHLALFSQGVEEWNAWRHRNPDVNPDISRADLSGAHLAEANLAEADLTEANLTEADLRGANLLRARLLRTDLRRADLDGAGLFVAHLAGADLSRAHLARANLVGADLSGADLTGASLSLASLTRADLLEANLSGASLTRAYLLEANLSGADLSGADLTGAALTKANLAGADLTGADLTGALLVETNLQGANLSSCRVYGISAWNVHLGGTRQSDLVITPVNEPMITVDNLEVAQFIYLLLHNEKIREVIDTITSKAVLILGRFTPKRKAVLDAMREELRSQNYLPILFDFEKPASRNFTETISTLAHMARFIIADLTQAKSLPQELQRIVPDLPSVPVQPILQASAKEYGMFPDFKSYPWVLKPYPYKNVKGLIINLRDKVIAPAERKALKLIGPMRQ
jgi:uncharacterized protein YjbI with pentapeptide repeats